MAKRTKAEKTKLLACDAAKKKNKLLHTKQALVSCYMGNHDMCRKHSLVCKGGENKNWVHQST